MGTVLTKKQFRSGLWYSLGLLTCALAANGMVSFAYTNFLLLVGFVIIRDVRHREESALNRWLMRIVELVMLFMLMTPMLMLASHSIGTLVVSLGWNSELLWAGSLVIVAILLQVHVFRKACNPIWQSRVYHRARRTLATVKLLQVGKAVLNEPLTDEERGAVLNGAALRPRKQIFSHDNAMPIYLMPAQQRWVRWVSASVVGGCVVVIVLCFALIVSLYVSAGHTSEARAMTCVATAFIGVLVAPVLVFSLNLYAMVWRDGGAMFFSPWEDRHAWF